MSSIAISKNSSSKSGSNPSIPDPDSPLAFSALNSTSSDEFCLSAKFSDSAFDSTKIRSI